VSWSRAVNGSVRNGVVYVGNRADADMNPLDEQPDVIIAQPSDRGGVTPKSRRLFA